MSTEIKNYESRRHLVEAVIFDGGELPDNVKESVEGIDLDEGDYIVIFEDDSVRVYDNDTFERFFFEYVEFKGMTSTEDSMSGAKQEEHKEPVSIEWLTASKEEYEQVYSMLRDVYTRISVLRSGNNLNITIWDVNNVQIEHVLVRLGETISVAGGTLRISEPVG